MKSLWARAYVIAAADDDDDQVGAVPWTRRRRPGHNSTAPAPALVRVGHLKACRGIIGGLAEDVTMAATSGCCADV